MRGVSKIAAPAKLWHFKTVLFASMLLGASFAGRAAFVGAICLADAFDTDVIAADKSGTAVGVGLTLVFAAHDAALLVGQRFDDIAGFLETAGIFAAVPGRCVCFAVQCREIIDGMADAVTGAITAVVGTADGAVCIAFASA